MIYDRIKNSEAAKYENKMAQNNGCEYYKSKSFVGPSEFAKLPAKVTTVGFKALDIRKRYIGRIENNWSRNNGVNAQLTTCR